MVTMMAGVIPLLCGARGQPATMLERADAVEEIGRENILPSVEAALDRAREIHGTLLIKPGA